MPELIGGNKEVVLVRFRRKRRMGTKHSSHGSMRLRVLRISMMSARRYNEVS